MAHALQRFFVRSYLGRCWLHLFQKKKRPESLVEMHQKSKKKKKVSGYCMTNLQPCSPHVKCVQYACLNVCVPVCVCLCVAIVLREGNS